MPQEVWTEKPRFVTTAVKIVINFQNIVINIYLLIYNVIDIENDF